MIIKLDEVGRFVIPKIIREALKIDVNGEIKLELYDDELIITNPNKDKKD